MFFYLQYFNQDSIVQDELKIVLKMGFSFFPVVQIESERPDHVLYILN